MKIAAVALGGATGSVCRYLVSVAAVTWLGVAFPWGTLAVNVAGSFALGAVMELALSTDRLSPELKLLATTGFLGGFTTYSTFNWETLQLFDAGDWRLALANALATVVSCLAAGAAGIAIARAALSA